MLRQQFGNEEHEPRYDSESLKQVLELAGRLQARHEETLTAGQIEAAASEIGMDPAFVRLAIEQMRSSKESKTRRAIQKSPALSSDTLTIVAALLIPFAWATVAFLGWRVWQQLDITLFFTLVAPPIISALFGFLSADRRAGCLSSAILGFGLFPTMLLTYGEDGGVPYLMFFVPLLALLSQLGASMRGSAPAPPRPQATPQPALRNDPPQGEVSRRELLDQLYTIQRKLEQQRRFRAFLSVDVVGSTAMKIGMSDMAVEYSFTQYRSWVEQCVRSEGGRMQIAAGDGLMCMFEDARSAARAAHTLQLRISEFNATHNRLPIPFSLRCGISAGVVAIDDATPIGHLQSTVIDRAAALQRMAGAGGIAVGAEIKPEAESVLGALDPIEMPPGEQPGYSWTVLGSRFRSAE